MEIVLQSVEVATALPLAHGQVVQQAVAAGLRRGGRNLVLCQYPLQTLDGQPTDVLHTVFAGHDEIHTGEAPHGTHIDDIVLDGRIAEPSGHEVFEAVHGRRSHGRFAVGLRDTEVVCSKTFILARDINTGLEVGMVNGETLNYFHDNN